MWNIEELNGYRPITTFWMDFDIAERFGSAAIKDTFNRAFSEWKTDYKYLTELVMVLNHKSWRFMDTNNDYCQLYADLYYKAHDYALKHLKGLELKYYFEITD